MNIEQQRARGIGRIGCMNLAAGEPPQQIRIDRAEGELAARGLLGGTGDIGQQPGELGAGKIRIEQKPGLGREQFLVAGSLKPRA